MTLKEETTIERTKKEISYGVDSAEYRDILERHGLSECFFCGKIEFKANMKRARVDENTIGNACPHCAKRKHFIIL
jgi:hypothetical protein